MTSTEACCQDNSSKKGGKDHGRKSLRVDVWFYTSVDASPSLKQDTWIRDVIEENEQMKREAQADPSLCSTEQQEQVVVRSRGTGTVGAAALSILWSFQVITSQEKDRSIEGRLNRR